MVANDFPDLWSYIGLDLGPRPLPRNSGHNSSRNDGPSNGTLCLAALQLSRTAGVALHVSLKLDGVHSSILPLLISSAPRWRRLQLFTKDESAMVKFGDLGLALNGIESLHLGHYGSYNASDTFVDPPLCNIFRGLPHISEISGHRFVLYRFELPWDKLRKVTIRPLPSEKGPSWSRTLSPNIDQFWLSILSSPVLEDFRIEDNVPSDFNMHRWPKEPLTLTSLRKLVIYNNDHILQNLTAPGLISLQFELSRRWDIRETAVLSRFIDRSKQVNDPICNLTMKVGLLEVRQSESHARSQRKGRAIESTMNSTSGTQWGLGRHSGGSMPNFGHSRPATEIELETSIITTLESCCDVLQIDFQHGDITTVSCSFRGKSSVNRV